MPLKAIFAGFAALSFLGGCATSTPYQQASDNNGGYNQQQIEDNRWTVSFSGNSLTDRQTVETYLLYRAAELTQQQGFEHFRVTSSETDADRRIIASPSAFYDPFYDGFHCNYRYFGRYGRIYPTSFHRQRSARAPFYEPRFGYYDPRYPGYGRQAFDFREITRYDATAEIIMGRGPKPDDAAYFDASQVLNNLAGRIERPDI